VFGQRFFECGLDFAGPQTPDFGGAAVELQADAGFTRDLGAPAAMCVPVGSGRGEGADRSPVDDSRRADVAVQALGPEPPGQRPDADFDPHQLDPVRHRSQIEVGWARRAGGRC